jgi:homogentisate 1,2-dioxygenase
MPRYVRLGEVPRKRHVAFRGPGGRLFPEELVGNHGFTGPASLVYHMREPTAVRAVRRLRRSEWTPEPDRLLRHRHFRTAGLSPGPSLVYDRVPLLFNRDVALSIATPGQAPETFYRNAQGDEIVFVAAGTGRLESALGTVAFRAGDYVVVPRGLIHHFRFDPGEARCLVIESTGDVRTPKRYRNEFGQLLEHSPFSERDIRCPEWAEPHDQRGDFPLIVKKDNEFVEMILANHPFDVVGWDGCYYPWALSIHDFEPRVGRVHLPPPMHQTFEGDGFVVCSFCPRPYDFDAEAVPAPYNHSNVMSDEVLYYASAEFMSRKGIERGSLTLHPDGLPHGPHPGRAEASIGQARTDELAVMVDTFRPLYVGAGALAVEDRDYFRSWLDE